CPANSFEASGTACGNPADTSCSNPDTCDGFGLCMTNDESAGTGCSDGDPCTANDQCNGSGACNSGAPTVCGPCEACDGASGCTPVIELACESPATGKSSLVISDNANNTRDKIIF